MPWAYFESLPRVYLAALPHVNTRVSGQVDARSLQLTQGRDWERVGTGQRFPVGHHCDGKSPELLLGPQLQGQTPSNAPEQRGQIPPSAFPNSEAIPGPAPAQSVIREQQHDGKAQLFPCPLRHHPHGAEPQLFVLL